MMVVLAGAMAIVLSTLRGATPLPVASHMFCSNATVRLDASGFPLQVSTTNLTDAANAGAVLDVNYFQLKASRQDYETAYPYPCVYWFGDDYPVSPPYAPVGTRSSDTYVHRSRFCF
jgi:hypothetical protein